MSAELSDKEKDNQRKQEEWTRLYYGSLVGAKCVGVEAYTDNEEYGYGECWPRLIFEHPIGGRITIEVSRDEEGNGPGFLFGLPMVPESDNPFLKDRVGE